MTIQTEIQSLSPSALIELFVLDTSHLPDGGLMHFHAATNELQQPVVWQGQTYTPLPVEADGFDLSSQGTLPRPKLRVANINGMFSGEVMKYDDLVGCKVTRKRTFVRFLDAVNFTAGNPSADPYQHFPDDVWYVERKNEENRYLIEFELSSAFDLQGVMLPKRQVLQNACPWRYRGTECGYGGTPFDKNNEPCAPQQDFCNKTLESCEKRFLAWRGLSGIGIFKVTPILPYGGFPGAVRVGT